VLAEPAAGLRECLEKRARRAGALNMRLEELLPGDLRAVVELTSGGQRLRREALAELEVRVGVLAPGAGRRGERGVDVGDQLRRARAAAARPRT
jgi:hypothetical protein